MNVSSIISIIYICIQLIALLLISIISARIVGSKLSNVSPRKTNTKLWIKIMWKMRGIYGSFLVHSFDTLTDILVIYDWWIRESKSGDIKHIDSRIMAYNSIAIIIIYKTISTIAIWSKYHDIRRSIFQFMDILILEEIYYAHLKLVDEINNKNQTIINDKTDTVLHVQITANTYDMKIQVDATLCFKYIRNIEAIFESMPQSILQLVFAMRTSQIEIIYALSVFQSILSMTNSIINNDNTQMTSLTFQRYKKKFPPSIKFCQHFFIRASEVIYRIGLLSLIWTVCGGISFAVIISYELFVLLLMKIHSDMVGINLSGLSMFQALIVMPSDLVFQETLTEPFSEICCFGNHDHRLITGIYNIFCCYWIGFIPSTLWRRIGNIAPAERIGLSFMEFLFMILYAIFYNNGERLMFLVSLSHGLYVFVVTLIYFIIYTQYRFFFPRVSLPHNIDPLSRYGVAFNGELEELKKIVWDDSDKCCQRKEKYEKQQQRTKREFWNKPCVHSEDITCIVLALANEKYNVVEWLKGEGATLDSNIFCGDNKKDTNCARDIVGADYWIEDQ
eukprot:422336_1